VALDLQKYLTLYLAEAAEHLAAFSSDLVKLEKAEGGEAATREIVDGLFRHAHSVKGMSASMGFEATAALAHRAEDLVDVFRRGGGRFEASVLDVLFDACDELQDMVSESANGAKPVPRPELAERLAEATRRARGPEGAAAAPAPTAPPNAPATATAPPAAASTPSPAPASTALAPPPASALAVPPPPPAGRGARPIQVEVEIVPSCPVPAVRGFLVVKKLAALGAVERAAPSVDELKAGRIPGKRLAVTILTGEPVAAVERALAQISDLAAVSVREAEPGRAAPAPAPAPAAPAPREVPAADGPRTVRVKTDLLDYFLDTVGELILATARIREVGRALPPSARPALEDGVDRLHAVVKDLHDKVMTVRMTPLATVTERLPRAARDVARKLGKLVEVEVTGAEIEIDRAILEELADPLNHLIRNAVDHGIEPSHLRQLAGKPPNGRVALHARRDRDRVILEIVDDGRGMEPAKLRLAAVARGALSEAQAAALGDREALQLACLPGLSTAEAVTDVSGRGVGLDVVKRTVEALGGTLEIDSVPGAGCHFTFRLPLTVAVQPVLLVRVAGEVVGLPIAKVHGAAQVELSRLDRTRGEPVFAWGGGLVPVQELSHLLGFEAPVPRDERAVVIAEGGGGGRIGLAVDGLLGQQEAVLKPLSAPLDAVPGLSAVTVLGNGRPVFILDVTRLLAA
jgi:two-component system chemotaxis sensor kinase CheA